MVSFTQVMRLFGVLFVLSALLQLSSVGAEALSLAMCRASFLSSDPLLMLSFLLAVEYNPADPSSRLLLRALLPEQTMLMSPPALTYNNSNLFPVTLNRPFSTSANIQFYNQDTNEVTTLSVMQDGAGSCSAVYGSASVNFDSVSCSMVCKIPPAGTEAPYTAPTVYTAVVITTFSGTFKTLEGSADNIQIVIAQVAIATLHDYSDPTSMHSIMAFFSSGNVQIVLNGMSSPYIITAVTGDIATRSAAGSRKFSTLTLQLQTRTKPVSSTTLVLTYNENNVVVAKWNGVTVDQSTVSRFQMNSNVPLRIVPHSGDQSGARGDPDFTGFRGQQYQVHGAIDSVFSIVSAPALQVNALFVFRESGVCPVYGQAPRTNCWSHPGTYFGRVGFKTAVGDHLLIESGNATHGFTQVTLNGVPVQQEVIGAAVNVTRVGSHLVNVTTDLMTFELENSDMFINIISARPASLSQMRKLQVHGLLGQTWRPTAGHQVLEGVVDDYLESSNDLFGDKFVFNRFGLNVPSSS